MQHTKCNQNPHATETKASQNIHVHRRKKQPKHAITHTKGYQSTCTNTHKRQTPVYIHRTYRYTHYIVLEPNILGEGRCNFLVMISSFFLAFIFVHVLHFFFKSSTTKKPFASNKRTIRQPRPNFINWFQEVTHAYNHIGFTAIILLCDC